ncbi:DUF4439 domain-containing protein [Cellulosimicrobium sp. BIT-GX5]|uniref:DUF4439 domain-containing protein n=1 Tax=Cellulosimicrobium composti TaxID=2672572 RepID=A0A6N7ZKJ0_9MICO|nr:DUF4439 domain-containing protein [Cellulosimicrobium composti]MTG89769.1 DUF4439 domain-containing protein [Cellulosimicrobium composti]
MTPHATPDDAAARPRRPRAARTSRRAHAVVPVLAAVLATSVLAAGCGVRLETPPPAEPSPDAVETARAGAVDDALAVAGLVADVTPLVTDPAALEVLEQASTFATQHADALGGVYDSGLGDLLDPDDGASVGADGAPDEPAPEEAATDGVTTGDVATDDVVAALVDAAQRAGASADVVPDAGLARLLASVAASEHLTAQRLAAVTGSTVPDAAVPPAPVVEDAPAGVGAADLATLVESEDAAGYGYEVRAAQTDGDVRTAAVARAAEHRARAQAWAVVAGTDGTAQDPRRVAYALPDDQDAAALARQVESDLAQAYASLVATAAASSRSAAVALLAETWASAVAWGAEPVAFPGLPERAAG